MSRGVVEKKGTERAVFVYTAKEKKTITIERYLCIRRRKKNHYYRAVLVCTVYSGTSVYGGGKRNRFSQSCILVCGEGKKKLFI